MFLSLFYTIFIPLSITFSRIILNYAINTYNFCRDDQYIKPVTQLQLEREKKYFFDAMLLYSGVLVVISYIFPSMFYNDHKYIECTLYTFATHICISEPLYYWVHRALHVTNVFDKLHYFHHLSYYTIPTTGLVQHSIEHIIYVFTFAPSVFIPYFIFNRQNYLSICLYFVMHDFCNAIGHSDISYYNLYYQIPCLKYIFYSPEFHRTHHLQFKCNYSLFMPIWDIFFNTYREPTQKINNNVIDFIFIVHTCSISSMFNTPQLSIYNIYNKWNIFFNVYIDFYLAHIFSQCTRFIKYWSMPTFKIMQQSQGKMMVLNKTPFSYLNQKNHDVINEDIIQLIQKYNKEKQTTYFGLGNLNKMKTLNNGGIDIAERIISKNKNIKILTGDTMTVASIYHSIITKNIDKLFFIGGTGKIGKALTTLLINRNKIPICIYSKSLDRYNEIKRDILPGLRQKLMRSINLNDITQYTHVIIGKQLHDDDINIIKCCRHMLKMYDYNVPYIPIIKHNISYCQIGVLENNNINTLNGYFDISCGLRQYQLYPCYAGCILGFIDQRKTNEVGEIDIDEVGYYWELGKKHGFRLSV